MTSAAGKPRTMLVVIPTTGGPIVITALRPRAGLPASAAFAKGDYRPLPWSGDYARLSAADGPLAQILPASAARPHELRLTGSFDTGRSWEVPVCLAHALLADGLALTDDPAEADLIIWSTGAVDLDLSLIAGDYALVDKIERSRALLDAAPGADLLVLLPPGAESAGARAAFSALVRSRAPRLLAAATIGAAAAAIGSDPRATSQALGVPPRRRIRTGVALAGIGLAAAAMVPGVLRWQAAPAVAPPAHRVDPPEAGSAPNPAGTKSVDGVVAPEPVPPEAPVIVEELRAPVGSSCRRVAFGADRPERRAVPAEAPNRLRASRLDPDLCGLALRPRASGASLSVGPELKAASLPSIALPDGAQGYLLREGERRNLVYEVQVYSGQVQASQAEARGARVTHALTR